MNIFYHEHGEAGGHSAAYGFWAATPPKRNGLNGRRLIVGRFPCENAFANAHKIYFEALL